jgi:peptidoglycan hydrolase-like protein with peptidoglycan-binding domain
MNRKMFVSALFCLVTLLPARADQALESVQRKLKEQGFYYGEITGKKDADTTAAIRRYQIRNGLKITGELNSETQRLLGVTANSPATPRPRPAPTPEPDTPDPREQPAVRPGTVRPRQPPQEDEEIYAPGPRGLRPETSGIFDGTPFEVAPPDVQQRVLIGAQTILTRRGYYVSEIDGLYGPAMNAALRAYQARGGIPPTGRLDMDTLASLGLLPGQRVPGYGPRHRRMPPPRWRVGPMGERIYIPR